MTIAELFVNIGLTGGEGVSKALTGVNTQMGQVASTSLAAKAGILAVVYGLERMTSFAGEAGLSLDLFGQSTGLSTQKLQQAQVIGREYQITNEEMSASIKGLQKVATEALLHGNYPAAARTLGIRMTRDTFALMKQLADVAKKLPPDIGSALFATFGISDKFFAMLRGSKMELDKVGSGEILSDRQTKNLANMERQWIKLWAAVRLFGMQLVGKYGIPAVQELFEAFKGAETALRQLDKLSDKFQAMKVAIVAIGVALGIAFAPITTAIAGIVYLLAEYQKFQEGKPGAISDYRDAQKRIDATGGGSGSLMEVLKDHKIDALKVAAWLPLDTLARGISGLPYAKDMAMKGYEAAAGAASGVVNNINNYFQIDGSHSPEHTARLAAKEFGKVVDNTARKMGAGQAQGK